MKRAQRVERITEETTMDAKMALDRIARFIRNEIDGHGPGHDAAVAELDRLADRMETLRDIAKAARVVET